MNKSHRELMDEMASDYGVSNIEILPISPPPGIRAEVSRTPFIKEDDGKIMASLVDPRFILGIANTMTGGAKKYGIDNWKSCEDPRRYKDALLRHLYAYLGGEEVDPESGLPHLDHVGFNTMALAYLDREATDDKV